MADDDDDVRERAKKHISFGGVTDKNVDQLRKLNLAVFPVKYNDKFYTDLSTNPVQLYTHLGYFSDIMVGAICCRVEPLDGAAFRVYVMTIGVLAPYRRLGLGKLLLQETLKACSEQADCHEITLHVQVRAGRRLRPERTWRAWAPPRSARARTRAVAAAAARAEPLPTAARPPQVGNDDAIKFYEGFGFSTGEVVKDYYTRLETNDAVVVSKKPPFV